MDIVILLSILIPRSKLNVRGMFLTNIVNKNNVYIL